MEDKKQKANEVIKGLQDLLGMTPEVINMTSELAEGDYTLEDGTKFRIDADGNLVGVVAPDAAEAEAEESAKAEEEAVEMAAQKLAKETLEKTIEDLKLSNAKVEKLEAEVIELSKTKKIVTPPIVAKAEKIELTANMTYKQRVAARTFNMTKTK